MVTSLGLTTKDLARSVPVRLCQLFRSSDARGTESGPLRPASGNGGHARLPRWSLWPPGDARRAAGDLVHGLHEPAGRPRPGFL